MTASPVNWLVKYLYLVIGFTFILTFLTVGCTITTVAKENLELGASVSNATLGIYVDEIEALIANLSLSQRIGQRFVTFIEGTEVSPDIESLIQKGYVAGIILNRSNLVNYKQAQKLIRDLQKLSLDNRPPISLFIMADQEGGRVARFRFQEMAQFPPAFYWARHNDEGFVEASAYVIGRELLSLGVNMNLAPVLDVYPKPDRSIIGDRSFGAEMEQVAKLGIAYLKGAASVGIIPVIKHFPGHGITAIDSHDRLPESDIARDELMRGIEPFRAAVNYGAPVVMTAHILFTSIDETLPATISERIIDEILRQELGFEGVVISDAIEMGALSNQYSPEETIQKAIEAGVDLILINSEYDTLILQDWLYQQVQSGTIPEVQINTGLRRILTLKQRYGLLDKLY